MLIAYVYLYKCDVYHIMYIIVYFDERSDTVYSIQHYVIKFVSDLRQISEFLRVDRFTPPIKMTATI